MITRVQEYWALAISLCFGVNGMFEDRQCCVFVACLMRENSRRDVHRPVNVSLFVAGESSKGLPILSLTLP